MRAIAVLTLAAAPLFAQQRLPEADSTPTKTALTTIDGCVEGMALMATSSVVTDVTGLLEAGITYRMTGSKEIKAQIKKMSGWMVRVTGVVQNPPADLPKGKKLGKATVFVGQNGNASSPSLQSTADVPPSVKVNSIVNLAERCDLR
jgi:hypothetical protein